MDLEGQLKKLEEITQRLESDDLPLEEAITLFEQGIKLASSVHTQLQKAKLRIEKVIETAQGTFSIEPLDLGSHGGRAVIGDGEGR